jgi:hypothetical protein
MKSMTDEYFSSRHNHDVVCGMPSFVAEHACCLDDTVVLSSHGANASRLDVLRIDQMNLLHANSIDVKGEVTCLSLFRKFPHIYIVAGSIEEGIPRLIIYSLDGLELSNHATQLHLGEFGIPILEAKLSLTNFRYCWPGSPFPNRSIHKCACNHWPPRQDNYSAWYKKRTPCNDADFRRRDGSRLPRS